MKVQVECHLGFHGEEEPVSFFLGQHQVRIMDIQDRWFSTDHQYFMLLDDLGDMYIIRRDFRFERWEMTMFDSGRAAVAQFSSLNKEPEDGLCLNPKC